ncbi:MAG: glycosyltransferase family 4 protein [Acetatifactor sp.]
MKKVVLLTNILSPYRSVFYQCMYEHGRSKSIDFRVLLMNDTESNRRWKYEEFVGEYSKLLKKRVFFGKQDFLYVNTDLKKCLDEMHPDILILSGSYTLLPVWQAKRWAKHHSECQLLFWSESHLDEVRDYNKLIYFIRDCVRKAFYSKMDGFWYPGEKAKELIKKYASENAQYIWVPNLIDNQKFAETADKFACRTDELREKYGLANNKKVFFSPMRLTKVKGLLPFLELVSQIENRDNLQIAIAGEGELEQEIRAFAAEKSIDLKLLGYRDGEEVAELLSCADVFFMPSLSDPSPLSCIEALWCRKPLLVSRHVGNAPEVIESGKNGFVFSYENPLGAVNMIKELLAKSPQWYQNAGEVSREIAREKFDLIENADRILEQLYMLRQR